ncbi:MAG: DUF2975 domain-containing protein [Lewinellaceae bacterium]|nr:DUF2975 domain-containing protein [Lewinellaceae bacterium]
MKSVIILILQAAILLFGIVILGMLIYFPTTEGRAANLDLFNIYTDPFILYGYCASVFFFAGLYFSFKLLGNIRSNTTFSTQSIKALRNIKYCGIILSALIVLAGVYIKFTHDETDDPAGFLGMCVVTSLGSIVIAIAANMYQKIVQKEVDLKPINDPTI